ncbi:alcohol dehydrogenase family protein [Arthrobacter sp. Cr_A7]|uniref:alcohol dehydrogenase family protein n=1 Tax=Arthrobacter sp. Cr_A7 TaxID=3031017 RepID=UPI0023DC5AFD|nr:alcohol dehydrogenase family protein [Arthrobacter sp. Cr_A7]MDF2051906.1 alcohol dehydrogenase family protein [Arthrobacter sp. Cr_A7]
MMTLPTTMAAVLLTGHGGPEKLEYRTDVPVPLPGADEVLIQVEAAGINNTDINTRIGWYSKAVSGDTNSTATQDATSADADDASWSGVPLTFPRIQGGDVYGRIVSVGENVDEGRLENRVIVRNLMRHYVDRRPYECWTYGSDCDGGFAQFAVAPSTEAYRIDSDLSPVELGAVSIAYSTAEGMLHRVRLGAEKVLITGASGGVGLAAVQLAKLRGAEVIAICSTTKADVVRAAGADQVIDRTENLLAALGPRSIDVAVDVVGGAGVSELLSLLRRGGRYAIAGAIGGPLSEIDLRTLYLNDLSLFGCTFQEDEVFENVVRYINSGQLHPVVSQTYPLSEIHRAQEDFISKKFPGKLVLVPPPVES